MVEYDDEDCKVIQERFPHMEWAHLLAQDIFEKLGHTEVLAGILGKDQYSRTILKHILFKGYRLDRPGTELEEIVGVTISRPTNPLYPTYSWEMYGQLKLHTRDLSLLDCSRYQSQECQERLEELYPEYTNIEIVYEERAEKNGKIEYVYLRRKLDPVSLAFSHAERLPDYVVKITQMMLETKNQDSDTL